MLLGKALSVVVVLALEVLALRLSSGVVLGLEKELVLVKMLEWQ